MKLALLRSPKWPALRRRWLKDHPACAVCGRTRRTKAKGFTLEVHHVVPVQVDRSLELDPTNLMTLCEARVGTFGCHFLAGHLGRWDSWNAAVLADCAAYRAKVAGRPVFRRVA